MLDQKLKNTIFLDFTRGLVLVISFRTQKNLRKKHVGWTVLKGFYTKSIFSLLKKLNSGITKTVTMYFQKKLFSFSGIRTLILLRFFFNF